MKEVFTTYLDFELEIGPRRGRDYPVTVTQSPKGEAHATMRFPYDTLTLEKRLVVVQNAFVGPERGPSQLAAPEELVVRDFGRDLFEALFTGEVRRCYVESLEQARQENKGLSLKLRFQPSELVALPWEFLYDQRQGEYVCLARTASVMRRLGLPGVIPSVRMAAPLRILAMIADPGDLELSDMAREKEQMEAAIQSLHAKGLVQLTWVEGSTWHHLHEAMKGGSWHAFHFLSRGGLYLRDEDSDEDVKAPAGEAGPLNPADLARTLADHPSLRVVLLNARAGARKASSASGTSLRSIFTNTADLLVRQGIPAVLTMPYETTDEAAIELFRAFYRSLALGNPVDVAVVEARKAVRLAVSNSVEWGAASLFMGLPEKPVSSAREPLRAEQAQIVEEPPRVERPAAGVSRPKPIVPDRPRKPRESLRERRPEREVPIRTSSTVRPDTAPPSPPKKAKEARRERKPEREAADRTSPAVEPAAVAPSPPKKAMEPRRERKPKRAVPILKPQPVQPEMVLIPAGEFVMGSDPEKDQYAYEAEQPQQRVSLPDYHIARTPITHAQYAAFVADTRHEAPSYWVGRKPPEGKEDYPVAYVSWYDAMAYCKWLSKKEGKIYRLPSEAEWEKAARGTEGRIYPWGDTWDSDCCNSKETGLDEPMLVQANPDGASPYGILDMAGNVWEWTGSLYKPYPYDARDGREDPQAFGKRVLRSGAYYSTSRRVRCAYRDSGYTDDSHGSYGFRVVLVSGKVE